MTAAMKFLPSSLLLRWFFLWEKDFFADVRNFDGVFGGEGKWDEDILFLGGSMGNIFIQTKRYINLCALAIRFSFF